MRRLILASIMVLLANSLSIAGIRLPAVFGDHMVLQRDRPVRVWGWADAGDVVTVSFGRHQATATAGADGRWQVELPAMAASGQGATMTIAAGRAADRIELTDVLVGEVWLCSGQSNMQWPVRWSRDAEQEAAAADHPALRLFRIPQTRADEPRSDVEAAWQLCTPATVSDFSAVGYFFGRALQQELDAPIGLIQSAWGGTLAEAWTPRDALADVLPEALRRADEARALFPQQRADFEARLAEWQAAAEPRPAMPIPPQDPAQSPHMPAVLFNGMIAPITPLSIRGAIWYQGESNVGRAAEYQALLAGMIQAWREAFDHPDLAFGVVQLANFLAATDDPGAASDWAQLREAQRGVAHRVPRTGLAVTIDIGEADDIHPRNKQDVGDRLARWALHDVYGRDIAFSGPTPVEAVAAGGRVRVRFEHAANGLVLKDHSPRGFALAGADGRWAWADATADGDSLLLHSDAVPAPTRVRYAWADNPPATLFNAAGLPASPFVIDVAPQSVD